MNLFENLNTILELPKMVFVRQKKYWQCACYLDGTPHYQRDKTKIKQRNGIIYLYEQGGDIISLYNYLVDYRNMTKQDAYNLINDKKNIEVPKINIITDKFQEQKTLYVPNFIDCFPLHRNSNFYNFCCSLFDTSLVNEIFEKYYIGENNNYTIFWHIDINNNICYDMNIPFSVDGHRDKQLGAYRKFQVGYGYTGKALFGEHLLKNNTKPSYVVESQKTAVIMSLFFNDKLLLATGGAMQLNADNAKSHKLLPDYDFSAIRWSNFGDCINIDTSLMTFLKRNEKMKSSYMKEKFNWFGTDIADTYLYSNEMWKF